ncbi:MAG TPA: 4-hydroxythreonine-4-phosphate dehydrogenase PdxA, partial [Thermoanaerobaculia bacterium]|nr:4-hydroxythreonine-4-phosphate dehydrogenase PdxA [Thermoanaerobaculia bacterium]
MSAGAARAKESARPRLVLSQGDPAGIGPELLLRLAARPPRGESELLFVAEWAALEAVRHLVPEGWERLAFVEEAPSRGEGETRRAGAPIPVLDPVGVKRAVVPGRSEAADAGGALAALDRAVALTRAGEADALVTLPVSKASIARHRLPDFRGHTDYLAEACGLERYGRDYLMAFLAPDLQVALLTVHEPLRRALDGITGEAVLDALACLVRHAGGRIAVAGLNPHAGEDGLLGSEEAATLRPAVEEARRRGWDVSGPESPDAVFARCRAGACDWVLALYHDQGLIAVKTAARGEATNWTLGLPYLRTSVDHGTAFDIAGRGVADDSSLRAVIATTVALARGELPRQR